MLRKITVKIILSALGGILTGLSFNSPYLSFLVWFSLVPFIYVLAKSSIKTGILSSIIFTLCYYGVAIFWIAQVTKLGLIFLLFYLSLYYVFFFLLGRYFLNRPLRIFTLPCLWVIVEFLKENIWVGFGWANLAYSQFRNFYLIQITDLGGAKFISFLIVMVNVLIWEAIYLRQNNRNSFSWRPILRKGIFVFFIFLACFSYSFYRLNTFSSASTLGNSGAQAKEDSNFLEVAVIQPNIPQELKWNAAASSLIVDKLNVLGKATKEDTLLIFPEAAWPYVVDKENFPQLVKFMKDIKRDGIMGAVIEEGGKFYNAALFFTVDAGQIRFQNSYRKIKLVPFGEYIPWRKLLSFIKVINSLGDMSRGGEFVNFLFKNKYFSVLICFEDVFPSHVARFAINNDFLINITNDAWFGGEPEVSQHLGIMTLRAVENRISIVRSANTGISGWVSFKGEIVKFTRDKKEVFFPGVKNFNISLNKTRSFYTNYGELFPIFCAIFLLGVFIKNSAIRGEK